MEYIFFYFFSSQTVASEDEEYDDVTVNQMLAPKTHETDATQILNNLLKEYDKKLRPDIGGECFSTLWSGIELSMVLKSIQLYCIQPYSSWNSI